MRKIIIALALPILLLLPTASATTSTSISGTFTATSFTVTNTKTAGPNTFVSAMATFNLAGGFSGSAVETATSLNTAKGLGVDVAGVRATFTGTVNGVSGTVVFVLTGNSAGGTFHGHFTILSGTGGLANLRGEGSFIATSMTGGTYTAQIHFN